MIFLYPPAGSSYLFKDLLGVNSFSDPLWAQPLSQPGRRSTVSHDAAVVAAETGEVDCLEVRRCRVRVSSLRPH